MAVSSGIWSPPSLQKHLCLGGNLVPEKPAANSPDPAFGLKEPEASFEVHGVLLTSFWALTEGERGSHTTAMTKEIISGGFSSRLTSNANLLAIFFQGPRKAICASLGQFHSDHRLGGWNWGKLGSLEMDNNRIVFQFCIIIFLIAISLSGPIHSCPCF